VLVVLCARERVVDLYPGDMLDVSSSWLGTTLTKFKSYRRYTHGIANVVDTQRLDAWNYFRMLVAEC
jgi:hypothetical protein